MFLKRPYGSEMDCFQRVYSGATRLVFNNRTSLHRCMELPPTFWRHCLPWQRWWLRRVPGHHCISYFLLLTRGEIANRIYDLFNINWGLQRICCLSVLATWVYVRLCLFLCSAAYQRATHMRFFDQRAPPHQANVTPILREASQLLHLSSQLFSAVSFILHNCARLVTSFCLNDTCIIGQGVHWSDRPCCVNIHAFLIKYNFFFSFF